MNQDSPVAARRHEDAVVIFLHGSGDTGEGIKAWLSDEKVWGGQFESKLLMEHGIRVIFPTARAKYYSLWGATGSVWFDRSELHPSAPEDIDGIEESLMQIQAIIKDALSKGISPKKIILGGFSMGGCMALHCMRFLQIEWAGIFALSSFLQEISGVLMGESYEGEYTWPPILMVHGQADDLVPPEWGRGTADRLRRLGAEVDWRERKGLSHELDSDEVKILYHWILRTLNSTAQTPEQGTAALENMTIQEEEENEKEAPTAEEESASVSEKGVKFYVKMEGNQAIATFLVPEGSEDLLCATTITARGAFFQLEKTNEAGRVRCGFYSPAPEAAAAAIADRVALRLRDPNPMGADEACALS